MKIKAVNYHFTRVCNYACSFCFYTQKNSHKLAIEDSFIGIKKLADYGVEKINFAGGEPFVYPKQLGEMVRYAKSLGMATSVITNGSRVTKEWFEEYGQYLDVFGVSCDSFNEQVNVENGRGKGNQIEIMQQAISLAKAYGCIIKLNTVVYKANHLEDMNEQLDALKVDRWKVFQMLYIPNENGSENTQAKQKRQAETLQITNEQYAAFLARHQTQKALVAETSDVISDSYVLVDEYMRFIFNDETNRKVVTDSILDQEIHDCLPAIRFNPEHFDERKGSYDWFKEKM